MSKLLWLYTDAIVHGSTDSLLAAEIAFRCLDRYMPQQELNLVQFSACGMAQLGTGAAKIVRTQAIEAEVRRVLLHYMPDQPLSDAFAPVLARAADTSEDLPIGQTGRRSPDVHCCLHPFWYGHGPDMPTFAYEVDYGPVFLPPL